MARGDGKAKKGMTRGGPKVKRMLLGGSVDGPAPSNASSMRSGYSGGTTGGNNFGAGGAGGLGGSSREGGFAGAGASRLESPLQTSRIQPGPGNTISQYRGPIQNNQNLFARRAAQMVAAYTPTGLRGTLSSQPFGGMTPSSTPDALTPTDSFADTMAQLGRYSRGLSGQITGMFQRNLAPADPVAPGTTMMRQAQLAAGPTYSNPSATPASDYRAAPAARPAAPSATPASDYRGAPTASNNYGPSAESLNNSFQRKAAQFFAEGSPTGFRGTPGSQYFGGQVPAPARQPVGGSYNSAMRAGRPAGTGAPEVTGPAFPRGLADRGPNVPTNVAETPNKITDRMPGMTGPTRGPDWATYGDKQPAQPPTPQPRPEVSRPSFGPGEPPSDRGSARGEGGSNKRRPVERRERMASGGMVNRGDGKARVKTKGKMI